MTKRRPLTPNEHAALWTYALENGRRWKSKLNDDWMNARTTGTLQALRNSHGPSWLVSFSLKKSQPSRVPDRAVSVTADNGDIYEAMRPGPDDPWTITYPEGEDRFHGTVAELRAHIRRLISDGPRAKIVL